MHIVMDDIGIRYIRLTNFKQHENTIIDLSKNITVITGDVDIGKSTVIQSITFCRHNYFERWQIAG